jgi:cysteine-rich repeat protein
MAGAGGVCGDGVVDPGEGCDDGNLDDHDGCLTTCDAASCGDGFVWNGNEDCDDGNVHYGDGCSPSCRFEVDAVAAGAESTCARSSDSGVKCWGRGSSGALGHGASDDRGDQPGEMGDALPLLSYGASLKLLGLSGGASHFCALFDLGVKCWGYNGDGELGLGDIANRGDQPGEMGDALPRVDLGLSVAAYGVVAGYNSTCARVGKGRLKCWGANLAGQLGLGDTEYRGDEPSEMGDNLPYVDLGTTADITNLSIGQDHACAVVGSGQIKCWGGNEYGKLGLGDTLARGVDPDEMGDNLPVVALGAPAAGVIALGWDHSCALLGFGHVQCWGRNDDGQLGLGDVANRGDARGEMGGNLPNVNLGADASVTNLVAGRHHTCALLADGTVKCWGGNDKGQLGYGDRLPRGGQPGDMGDALPAVNLGRAVLALSAGGDHTCALLEDRTVRCWGDNGYGELGLGDMASRGDDSGEMGEALPAVDVGF